MGPDVKRRWDEHKYNLERNSFILSILEAKIVMCQNADCMGYPDSETALIAKISPQYVALIRSLRNRFPNDSPELLAQELFNMVFVEDNGYKRDYSHFQKFHESTLDEWHLLRKKQQRLRNERVNLDAILSDAKHAYWAVHGKDIEFREISRDAENKEQQEEQIIDVELEETQCGTEKE